MNVRDILGTKVLMLYIFPFLRSSPDVGVGGSLVIKKSGIILIDISLSNYKGQVK